jgi:hypothetical protein
LRSAVTNLRALGGGIAQINALTMELDLRTMLVFQ